MTRKEFLVFMLGSATVAACGGSQATGNCSANGTAISIEHNTGHSFAVPKEDVVAGVEKTYHIQGLDPSHDHTVTLTVADMQALQQNQGVTKTSSINGSPAHSHVVHVTCA